MSYVLSVPSWRAHRPLIEMTSNQSMTFTYMAQRIRNLTTVAAFVFLSSVIATMASERVYWYWAGFNLSSIIEISVFYAIPMSAALWALVHAQGTRIYHVVLASAFFAFIVEGVLTPIIYVDGPLPIMAAMFAGWHGMIAFVGFLFLARRWLLERRTRLITGASAVFGVLWGVWAIVAAFGDNADIEGGATILGPAQFAIYALGVGSTLAAAHWLIGFVWPASWRPGKTSTIAIAVLSAAYMAVAVVVVVPWAPLKLGILLGGTYWLMRRGRRDRQYQPTIIDGLTGRVRARDASLLLVMPIVAGATYALVWVLGTPALFIEGGYWLLVLAQTIGGAAAFIWAARRALKSSDTPESVEPELSVPSG